MISQPLAEPSWPSFGHKVTWQAIGPAAPPWDSVGLRSKKLASGRRRSGGKNAGELFARREMAG
jgi:hypothetical protein